MPNIQNLLSSGSERVCDICERCPEFIMIAQYKEAPWASGRRMPGRQSGARRPARHLPARTRRRGLQLLIRYGDAGMLAHVLTPRDDERFQVAVGIGQVAKDAPAYGALAAAEDAHRVHRRQEIACPLGGNPVFNRDQHRPVFGSGDIASVGSGQCIEGDRSMRWIACSGQRHVAASPPTSANAATESAVALPNRSASAPHPKLPTAISPWNTSR